MAEILPRTCAYYRALFGPYIQGTLDAAARRELAAHLAECRECASVFGLEWKASVEVKGGTPLARGGRRPLGLPFSFPFLRGGKGRSSLILMAVTLGAILIFARMGNRGSLPGSAGAGEGKVLEETVDLLKSQRRLNDALVQVALGKRTPVPRKLKFQAMETLRRVRDALLGGKGKRKELAALLHPLFRIEEIGPGGMPERTIDRAALLESPELGEDLLEADQFQWWSADDESLCLYSFGASPKDSAFLVFLRDPKAGLRLYWVLRRSKRM